MGTSFLEHQVERLLRDGAVEVEHCTLVLNSTLDCVVGTDPLGIDSIVAFETSPEGCRTAVRWAQQVGRQFGPAPAGSDPDRRERPMH